MSGNFNDPRLPDSTNHATADSIIRDILDDSRSRNEISPSGELYIAFERHMHRVQGGTENRRPRQLPTLHSMTSERDPSRREQIHREVSEASPLFVLPPQPQQNGELAPRSPSNVSMRLARFAARRAAEREVNASRPRMMPSDRYMERARSNLSLGLVTDRQLEEGSHSIMQNATRLLENANSNGRARLDSPLPHVTFPIANSEYPGEREHRRAKRRKLDADNRDDGWRGFSYGRYGQVEQGKLKMELVSCDGGTFEGEPPSRREEFEPENVLLDDNSVYCTKSNRCNLVLRHQGSTTFCLTELVIKAPHQNFTAPIQEGLVFVSMTSNDLLTRTAKYQIQYSPPKPRRPAFERNPDELLPIISIRHDGDGSMSTAQARARRLYDIGLLDEDCDSRTAQMPTDFTNTEPGFSNTTEQSDSEDEDMPGHSRVSRARNILLGNFDSDSDSDNEEPRNRTPWHDDYDGTSPRLRRRETASDITLSAANQAVSQEEVAEGNLMVPHAKFFIERDKSKTTIKFDPPVSGRYILLKLWSPHPSPAENIDIQTVIVKGFAGPRYFPAIQMR